MKDIKKTNWFEERELPNIYNDLDLLKAFSIVKNRFNGNPRCYTRNDYILFINTIYAAFRDLYYSTHLQDDLTTECQVGYVKKGHTFKKGDSLYSVLEQIFTGEGDIPDTPIEPDEPTIVGFYTNIIKPVGRDYYDENWEGKSNLIEGTPFSEVQYSSEEFSQNTVLFDKTDWGYLASSSWRANPIMIESSKPLNEIIKEISLHQTTGGWNKNTIGTTNVELSWFDLKKSTEGKYVYELNESKATMNIADCDYLIKIEFI